MLVLGFMSGTSLDGVDVALIDTDGERVTGFGQTGLIPFSTEQRAILINATAAALAWNGVGPPPAAFADAATLVDTIHIHAARQVIGQAGRAPDLIGFHGQTVLHRPERSLSVQLGDPQAIADALACPVVAGLREDDLIAGGQGAPLVPVYHRALADWLGLAAPIAFLNVGGVANLTWIGRDGMLIACDTGPGNGLIDLVVQARGAGRYDDGGRLAAAGRVDPARLRALLDTDYFRQAGPKSLDRYDFPLDWAADCRLEDAAATLTAFTAEAVALAAAALPEAPAHWIVCGGGCHNPVLMAALRARLGDCRAADERGLRGDFIEAEAMAFLAARSVRALPITFPGTTGVAEPRCGGTTWHPRSH